MSKSEATTWADLPDWKCEEAYSFLNDASLEMWAWEFLRRNPEYCTDYNKCYGHGAEAVAPSLYFPPKAESETVVQYVSRMVHEDRNYRIVKFPEQCCTKWGVSQMIPPSMPLPAEGFFQTSGPLPKIISDVSHVENYSFGVDQHNEFGDVIGTRNAPLHTVAIVVFDLTAPISLQINKIQHQLESRQKELEVCVSEPENTSGQIYKWKRHLRALDARRSTPKGTQKMISLILGGDKTADDFVSHEKRGEDYLKYARNTMRSYRKILLHSPVKVSE